MQLTEQQRSELIDRYGSEIVFVDKPNHPTFCFRKPTQDAWRKYWRVVRDPDGDAWTAKEQLCADCVVSPTADGKPDAEAIEALWNDFPALPNRLYDVLETFAGWRDDAFVDPDSDTVQAFGKDVMVVKLGAHGPLVFRKPTRAIWGSFQFATRRADDDGVQREARALHAACLLKGTAAELDAITAAYPALGTRITLKLSALAGMSEEGLGKASRS